MNYTVPRELLRPILEAVASNHDLCSISVVSHYMQSEAERLIYRDLSADSGRAVVSTCRRVCTMPRVWPYVRSLHLEWNRRDGDIILSVDPYAEGTVFTSFYSIMAATLKNVGNLRHLTLLFSMGFMRPDESGYPTWILRGCPFKLLTFTTWFKMNTTMVSFICEQSELRRLHMPGMLHYPSYVQIPTNIAPRLCVLRTHDPISWTQFIQKRNITHLSLESVPPIKLPSVIALEVGAFSISLPDLMPQLEHLSAYEIEGVQNGSESVSTWLTILSRLKQLSSLEIEDRELIEIVQRPDMLPQFRAACSSLDRIRMGNLGPNYNQTRDYVWNGASWDDSGLVKGGLSLWEELVRKASMSWE